MNSNKTEIYGLTRFHLHMYAVKKIPEQVHVYVSPNYFRKVNNRFENLDCSNKIKVLVGCNIFTVSLKFHQ